MFEHIITPIVYLCGAGITFLLVINIMFKTDSDVQVYCDSAIHEFVDESRASGYISAENYLDMVNKMNNTLNLYDIKIVHKSKKMVPNDAGGYMDSYTAYYNNEILSVLFPDSTDEYVNYPLKNGDYLQVSYQLKEPTITAKLMLMIQTHSVKSIHGSYGAYVGSTEENGNF